MKNIGEQQITPQTMQSVASDVNSQQGQSQLFQKAVGANVAKQQLDAILSVVSGKIGTDHSSRVKDIETAGKKIAQKRMEGRNYQIDDINDMLGGRLVLQSEKQLPEVQKAIETLSKKGLFDIDKKERVNKDTYSAYHYDIIMPNKTKAEIQIMTGKEEAESVANHSLRSKFGENPPEQIKLLREAIKKKTEQLPNDKAHALAQAIQTMRGEGGGIK